MVSLRQINYAVEMSDLFKFILFCVFGLNFSCYD